MGRKRSKSQSCQQQRFDTKFVCMHKMSSQRCRRTCLIYKLKFINHSAKVEWFFLYQNLFNKPIFNIFLTNIKYWTRFKYYNAVFLMPQLYFFRIKKYAAKTLANVFFQSNDTKSILFLEYPQNHFNKFRRIDTYYSHCHIPPSG